MAQTRQLASILFTDIQGYTALMQRDETKASKILNRFHDLINRLVPMHEGEIANYYGDGSLCIFHTPDQAVQCALILQQKFSEKPSVPARIGIHNGTIIREDNKVFGHSINVASRIESIGVAGSILLSKKVRDEIKNKPEFQITTLGSFNLKDVDEPLDLYALGNEGVVVPRTDQLPSNVDRRKKRMLSMLVLLLVVVLAAIMLKPYLFHTGGSTTFSQFNYKDQAQIAIDIFENNTSNSEYDIIGKMAADWISHGIVENQIAPVISHETIKEYSGITRASILPDDILNALSGEIKLIDGAYYVRDSNLIFQCSVVEPGTNRPLYAFKKVTCSIERPLDGIEQLKEQILGYWVTRHEEHIAHQPPTFSAYELYLRAKDYWARDYDLADSLLRKSIALDPAFHHSKVLLAHLYYNVQDFETLDSITTSIEADLNRKNPIQVNAVQYLRALLEGNNRRVFETYQKEYASAPQDLFKNTAMMVIATNFVRKPELAIQLYEEINNDLFDYSTCDYCVVRAEIMAAALISLGKYDEVIKLLEPLLKLTKRRRPREYLSIAYIRTQNKEKLDDMLRDAESTNLDGDINYLYFLTAYHAQLSGVQDLRKKYAEKAIELYSANRKNHLMLGRSYFILEDYERAKASFEAYLQRRPDHFFSLGKLAAISFMERDDEKAESYLEKMQSADRAYDFGYSSYFIGQTFALAKKYPEAFQYLKEAVKAGDILSVIDYENDPLLAELHGMPEWDEVISYWEIK